VYESPILVLMDLKLPKVPGLEILRRIRDDPRTRQQPVVILTSSKEQEDVAKGYNLGVNGYVRKPVDSQQFQNAISQLGMYWLVLSELPPRIKDPAKTK
jgi:two-component system response regulator